MDVEALHVRLLLVGRCLFLASCPRIALRRTASLRSAYVPGFQVLGAPQKKGVDGRSKSGHDEVRFDNFLMARLKLSNACRAPAYRTLPVCTVRPGSNFR